jgi:GH43 family beta-xylosidase
MQPPIRRETKPSRCCNFWAPELRLLDGPYGRRWYITHTAGVEGTYDQQHVHVLESEGTDPLGTYHHAGQVDPFGDNRCLFFIVPLENPWTPSGPAVRISTPTYDWETAGGEVIEGPVVGPVRGVVRLRWPAHHDAMMLRLEYAYHD